MAKRKAKIFYVAMDDFWRKEEKLAWLRENPISKIAFESITPDEKHNWINQTDNDFDTFVPLRQKRLDEDAEQIFRKSSLGISTNRDEWIYDISRKFLTSKIKYFLGEINRYISDYENRSDDDLKIKWSRDLRSKASGLADNLSFIPEAILKSSYRPFTTYFAYLDKILIDRFTDQHISFAGLRKKSKNRYINYTDSNSGKPFMVLGTTLVSDLHFVGAGAGTMVLPQYFFEKGIRHDNITDWAVEEFARRGAVGLTKEDIFHYVYAVLHYPPYREKYEQNLKREFPRIPVYEMVPYWASIGKSLMDLHLNYETVKPYPLVEKAIEPLLRSKNPVATAPGSDTNARGADPFIPKPVTKLKADKENGVIEIDTFTRLEGVPAIAWEYKLGNRSALEWILDQYKERKPKDPTIAEKFNTYKFADHKAHVIDLLKRVCTVSVKTMEIINSMPEAEA